MPRRMNRTRLVSDRRVLGQTGWQGIGFTNCLNPECNPRQPDRARRESPPSGLGALHWAFDATYSQEAAPADTYLDLPALKSRPHARNAKATQ